MKKAIRLILTFLTLTTYYLIHTTSVYASLTDQYACGGADEAGNPTQIVIGSAQSTCQKNGQTCTAWSHYLFTDENGQAICDNNNCDLPCTTPTITLTPTPATAGPTLIPTMGPEEKAVYNVSQGTLPEELAKEQKPPQNIFDQLKSSISNLFNGLFFGFIIDKPKMYVQSDNLDRSTVPQEFLPTGTVFNNNMKDYLGGSTGIYGVNLPSEIQQINPTGAPIGQSEKAFEQASFPEGVNPITGQR